MFSAVSAELLFYKIRDKKYTLARENYFYKSLDLSLLVVVTNHALDKFMRNLNRFKYL